MADVSYLLRSQPTELRRLRLQAEVWEPAGRSLLETLPGHDDLPASAWEPLGGRAPKAGAGAPAEHRWETEEEARARIAARRERELARREAEREERRRAEREEAEERRRALEAEQTEGPDGPEVAALLRQLEDEG